MCWSGNGWMTHGWGWLMTAVVMTVFLAVVIIGAVVALRYVRPGGQGTGGRQAIAPTTTAEDLLAHRFARGEIDDTEFRQRISALREHR